MFNPNAITVKFSNPRINESPYNEALYGPEILEGVLGDFDKAFGIFTVRVKNIDYDVDPLSDPHFKLLTPWNYLNENYK